MDELSNEQLNELRADLIALRVELSGLLQRSKHAAKPVTLDQQAIGRVSRIDAIQQQKMVQANRHRQQLRLTQVGAALKAMDHDEYGWCRRCEEPIGWARLKVKPETRICLQCQSHLEGGRSTP